MLYLSLISFKLVLLIIGEESLIIRNTRSHGYSMLSQILFIQATYIEQQFFWQILEHGALIFRGNYA
jgi:hypothetical protein